MFDMRRTVSETCAYLSLALFSCQLYMNILSLAHFLHFEEFILLHAGRCADVAPHGRGHGQPRMPICATLPDPDHKCRCVWHGILRMTGRGAGVSTVHKRLRTAVSLWQDVNYLMDTTKTPIAVRWQRHATCARDHQDRANGEAPQGFWSTGRSKASVTIKSV